MDIIKLNNIEIFAYHGLKSEEKILGLKFQIDAHILVDKLSSKNDLIDSTINYEEITKLIVNNFTNKRFNLLESIAERISEKILEIPKVNEVKIKIRKPSVALNCICDSVEIEINRK